MLIGNVDTNAEVFVIAEIGNNHEGNATLAAEMIHAAAETGVHAVKFQTFVTELYVNPKEEARFKRLKGFELSQEQFRDLAQTAKKCGVQFISTPFDLESAAFLEPLVTAYKIGSGENTFFPLLECVAKTGRPLIMSSGIADLQVIKHSHDFIFNTWKSLGIRGELAILHCVSAYPVQPAEANLLAIRQLQNELHCTIGYSDHVLGVLAAASAVALGARIVEKHFTLDKQYSDFRDHSISADPVEMKLLVDTIREVSTLLGTGVKKVQESETGATVAARRSICAKRDLPAGHIISAEDITWTRPAGGLAPGEEQRILKKRLKTACAAGEWIRLDHLGEG